MAKQKDKEEVKPKPVKILSFYQKEGAYGFKEFEIDQAHLDKFAKPVGEEVQPDIFAVCVNNIIRKVRDIFEI